MLTTILTRARDNRFVWDLFGPIYNRHIHEAIRDLYEYIAQGLRLDGPAQVMDVGTGPGYVALHAAQRYPESSVVGVDFSPMQVRAAERVRRRKGVRNCRFIKANAMELPFDPERFDAVVSVGSIKHWPDASRGLRQIERVLRPGGLMIMAETDRDASDEALKAFLDRFAAWYLRNPLLFWAMRHIVFGRSYSQEEIVAMVKEAGFTKVRTENLDGCPYVIVKAEKQ